MPINKKKKKRKKKGDNIIPKISKEFQRGVHLIPIAVHPSLTTIPNTKKKKNYVFTFIPFRRTIRPNVNEF